MMNKTQPHIYEGKSSFCITCFKGKSDPIHHTDTKIYVSNDVGVIEQIAVQMICSGHECARCKQVFTHDYECNIHDGKRQILCTKCAGDSASLINRPDDIKRIEKDAHILTTPRETIEQRTEHIDFVQLNIFKLPDGSDNPNYLADWQKHYDNLQRFIEKYRNYQSAALQAKADKQLEDNTKLSPEEREQYERDAKKLKKKNVEKVKKEKEIVKLGYQAMLAKLTMTLRQTAGMDEKSAKEQAEKMIIKPKSIEIEESEENE